MKFAKKKAVKKSWKEKGIDFWIYSSEDDIENASSVYIEVKGSHGKVKTTLSDRVYYVVDGKGEFEIDGEVVKVEKSDVVVVPKNTPYDYRASEGVLKLFLVHVPAFDPDHEVSLEEK